MKSLILIFITLFSFSLFAQDSDGTYAEPTGDTKKVEPPVGTLVPPTKKQLNSVKKPKKKKQPATQ